MRTSRDGRFYYGICAGLSLSACLIVIMSVFPDVWHLGLARSNPSDSSDSTLQKKPLGALQKKPPGAFPAAMPRHPPAPFISGARMPHVYHPPLPKAQKGAAAYASYYYHYYAQEQRKKRRKFGKGRARKDDDEKEEEANVDDDEEEVQEEEWDDDGGETQEEDDEEEETKKRHKKRRDDDEYDEEEEEEPLQTKKNRKKRNHDGDDEEEDEEEEEEAEGADENDEEDDEETEEAENDHRAGSGITVKKYIDAFVLVSYIDSCTAGLSQSPLPVPSILAKIQKNGFDSPEVKHDWLMENLYGINSVVDWDEELKFRALEYASGPHTDIGKVLFCLSAHSEVEQATDAFFTAAWPANAVYCMAHGMKLKGKGIVRTTTTDKTEHKVGRRYMRSLGLDAYVSLNIGTSSHAASKIAAQWCPEGKLDLLSMDPDLGIEPSLYEALFEICRPWIVVINNSGCENYLEECKDDAWHAAESNMYKHAKAGTKQNHRFDTWYDLVIDRKPAGLLDDSRYFSVYIAKQ